VESQKLLNWGYTAFDAVRLFDPEKPLVTPQVWKGKADIAKLGVAAPIVVTLPQGEGGKPQTTIERTDPLLAPLAKGQRVGTVKVSTAAGVAVASVPLIAIEEVPEAGFIGRAWDALKLWIK
jgi:serine-type D-Ala-D-Ala carboxypeptidase (penicillin-binding protein 5/6)